MPEPTPNTSFLNFLPDMGEPIDVRMGAVKPEDPEAEAVKAAQNLQVPNWLPDQMSFGAPSRTEAPAPAPEAQSYTQPAPTQAPVFSTPMATSDVVAAHNTANRPSEHVPQPTEGRTPGSVVIPGKPVQHPVITALLRDFGIVTQKSREVRVGKNVFTIRAVNAEILSYAVSCASKMAQSNDEYSTRLRLLIGTLAISGINGVPTYELFNIDLTKIREAISDPFFPPFTVVVKTSVPLIRLMFEDLGMHVLNKVIEAYEEHFGDDVEEEEVTEAPSMTSPVDPRVRFKCNIEGCGHVEDTVPEFVDKQKGQVMARYCPKHGKSLTPIAYTKDLGNIPLA